MRCNTATVVSAVVILLGTAADSAKHNVPGQARTRTCVAMKGEKVPLRYADGTLTGWFVRGDDPSMQGGNQKDCPPGSMEMDAHEIITTANGMKLYFHPGGGPDHYKNWIDNGQYGHIAAEDMKALPPIKPSANGKPAPLHEGARYIITPTRIPQDMFYKPNADEHGHTGSTYLTYGDPGFEKTGGRDEWTYNNWSWVQNGGAEYPANKCGGGGMVRAMGKSGTIFTAAAVEPIIGYSYGPDNQINGRVTAVYGKTTTGPGEKGDAIFGWLPLCYQKTDDIIVPCVRRSSAAGTIALVPNKSAYRL